MYDAFISYSRGDLSAVQDLKQQIDSCGLRVFLDLESLRAGHDWPSQLGNAVQKSRLLVLCWSKNAESSDWVKAEIHLSLSTKKLILPWLLDSTPLIPILQQKHGIQGSDPTLVVKRIVDERKHYHQRVTAGLVTGVVLLVLVFWLLSQAFGHHNMVFHGHIIDEQGNAVNGATVEAERVRGRTNMSGEFDLVLPGPPLMRALRVTAWKPGYRKKTIDTQSNVPDFGIILDKER